jgi:hypothetical protein
MNTQTIYDYNGVPKQFQEVEKLEPTEKHLVKTFLDAFITKKKIQQLAL